MDLTLADMGTLLTVVKQIDQHPVGIAGRFAGFSQDEQSTGVPLWAWGALTVAGGVALYAIVSSQVRKNSQPWMSQGNVRPPNKKRQVFGRW